MQIDLENKNLTESEREGVLELLDSQNHTINNDLEQIWYLLDKVWDDMGCDNKNLDWEKIADYYKHPVWLLNGLFIESDPLSMSIRKSIAHFIAQKNFKKICDYGGGFGTLAKEIAGFSPQSQIFIYEPFPTQYAKSCIAAFENISFIDKLEPQAYDCLVSTDVLEHVDDVLSCFEGMLESLRYGGVALLGNCFYPVIKCHLPKNFHYRYSFRYFAKAMGAQFDGVIQGAEYVEIYTKHSKTKNPKLIMGGGVSRLFFAIISILDPLRPLARKIKHKLKKN